MFCIKNNMSNFIQNDDDIVSHSVYFHLPKCTVPPMRSPKRVDHAVSHNTHRQGDTKTGGGSGPKGGSGS